MECDVIKIESYLTEHLGENKLLDEWVLTLNDLLPNNRRKTTREMAHLFSFFNKKGTFDIERQSQPSLYCFN